MGPRGQRNSAKQGGFFLRTARKNKCRLGLDGLFVPPNIININQCMRAKMLMSSAARLKQVVPENATWIPLGRRSNWSSHTLPAPGSFWDLRVLKLFFHSLKLGSL